jgi:cytochrome bd-type quinol oxidase subunit 1
MDTRKRLCTFQESRFVMKTKHSALLLACLLVASTITLPAHDDWTWEKINQIANNPTKLAAIKGKAEKGDAGAQYILGRVYDQGNDQGRQTESTK